MMVAMMKVSVNTRSFSDEDLKFIKQIGVDWVDTGPMLGTERQAGIASPQEGTLDLKKVSEGIKKIRAANLNISTVRGTSIQQALMGKPEGEKELEDICNFIKVLGEESIPVMHLGLETRSPRSVPGRVDKAHRGGYLMGAFSLDLMRREIVKRDMNSPWAYHFRDKITFDEYFHNCVKILERVIPIAEDSEVKLMFHADDPPVEVESLIPGITNSLLIRRLFEAVPSKNIGLQFCCGARYESGENIYDLIRLFGKENKIFHVHLRNVRGTIPSVGGYEEVAIDDGDINIFKVLQTLKEVGYGGTINPDHFPTLIGDNVGRASLAFSIGYIKALLSIVE